MNHSNARQETLIDDLVTANHILAHEEVVDSYGHVSLRDPTDQHRFWLSSSVSPEQVTHEDILTYDLDARAQPETSLPQYSERVIHSAIYRARPDVQAVIHGHADETIPFTVTDVKLRPVLHVAGIIGANIPVWDIREGFGDTDLLVVNQDHAASLAASLGQGRVVLMRGHGFTVAAESLELAVRTAIYLKANARIQLEALRLGNVKYLSDDEIAAVNAKMGSPAATRRVWENWKNRLGRPTSSQEASR